MTKYSPYVNRARFEVWRAESRLRERMSHCQMTFFILGCTVAFTSLFLLKMLGLSPIEIAVTAVIGIVATALLSGAIARKRTVPFYGYHEFIPSFVGALLCILAFLMGAIK